MDWCCAILSFRDLTEQNKLGSQNLEIKIYILSRHWVRIFKLLLFRNTYYEYPCLSLLSPPTPQRLLCFKASALSYISPIWVIMSLNPGKNYCSTRDDQVTMTTRRREETTDKLMASSAQIWSVVRRYEQSRQTKDRWKLCHFQGSFGQLSRRRCLFFFGFIFFHPIFTGDLTWILQSKRLVREGEYSVLAARHSLWGKISWNGRKWLRTILRVFTSLLF